MTPTQLRNIRRGADRLHQCAKWARKVHDLPYPCDSLRVRGWVCL